MTGTTDILFVHNNFPGQYKHLVRRLAQSRPYRLAAIGAHGAADMAGVTLQRYAMPEADIANTHCFAQRFDLECRRAEQVLYAANLLKASGISPRLIFAHPGWGETLPLRQVFPEARLCTYCEFYYRPEGADVGFDTELQQFGVDGRVRIELRNAATLLALAEADAAVAPTHWQKSLFPKEFHSKIRVIHDGVDTGLLKPAPAVFRHPDSGLHLARHDEVITYVARNLEPYRGFHVFMRALPRILEERPQAQICIAGDDGVSYGHAPAHAESWKAALLAELGGRLDLSRVHFLGSLPYEQYTALLRVSRVHTYLTYPFVLSWSLLEAMALGCVVVASDTKPLREVIRNGLNGLSVPFFDTDALAATISAVAGAPQRFEPMRRAARETVVSSYDFDRVTWPQFDRLIAELVSTNARPSGAQGHPLHWEKARWSARRPRELVPAEGEGATAL